MKKLKSILAVVLIFVLSFSLTGCMNDTEKAEKIINSTLKEFKSENIDKMMDELGYDGIDKEVNGISIRLLMQTAAKNFDYKIISSEKTDDDTISVKVEITTTDMKAVFSEVILNLLDYGLSNMSTVKRFTDNDLDKKMYELFMECVSKDNFDTVTTEVDLNVTKGDNGKWEFHSYDELIGTFLDSWINSAGEFKDALTK